jgi:hypothetical protein
MKEVAFQRMIIFFIYFFILALFITIIELCHYYGNNCGIPLHLWLDVYVIIVCIRYLTINWLDILVVGYRPFWMFDWECIKILVLLIVLVAWLIYGYVIYFSDDNNC